MAWVDFDHWSKSTTPENVCLRCQSNRTITLMKIVNQDLWLGMSSASNGAKSWGWVNEPHPCQYRQES